MLYVWVFVYKKFGEGVSWGKISKYVFYLFFIMSIYKRLVYKRN